MRYGILARTLLVAAALSVVGPRARGADDLPTVPDAHVEEALVAAGANRAELERFLAHAEASGDPRRRVAARFLVAHMPGKGYVVTTLEDAKGTVVPYDPLAYPDLESARAALEALEERHGSLEFSRRRIVLDVETLSAAFLIAHLDAAFGAWEGSPAGRRVGFGAFLEHVLPYRGSEEPAEAWMPALCERLRSAPAEVLASEDPVEVWAFANREASSRIRFDDRYYLHPTDQGFAEMESGGLGRCEDITNRITYAARALALATAADFTPAWGHSDNNHAWNVLLDADGRGSDPSNAHAAKVFRKTWSIQRDSLPYRLPPGREAPNRFLASRTSLDVTDQYAPTSDVTVVLDPGVVGAETVAYACVFNGGAWVPIHGGEIRDGRVVLDRLGRGLAWMAAVHDGKDLRPVGVPWILHEDGRLRPLPGTGAAKVTLLATATSPEQRSPDTGALTPVSHLARGTTYRLQRWEAGAWTTVAEAVAGEEPLRFEGLPSDGLYWLVAASSRRLERIFTIEDGRQRFW